MKYQNKDQVNEILRIQGDISSLQDRRDVLEGELKPLLEDLQKEFGPNFMLDSRCFGFTMNGDKLRMIIDSSVKVMM